VGGEIQGKLWPRDDAERAQAGCDLDTVLDTSKLCGGESVFFAATGITSGEFLHGVRYTAHGAVTHSIVMRSRSGTVRYIEAHHNTDKLKQF
jgi:fructose-1,6-bisphosphatase II